MAVAAFAFLAGCSSALAFQATLTPPEQPDGPSTSAPAPSPAAASFTARIRDGQKRFQQGETIKVELGYNTPYTEVRDPFAATGNQKGLAVDEFCLKPTEGVADPLRDFFGSVGGWSGPPARSMLFVEEAGRWTSADLNEWFRFDKPGHYSLYVAAHPVRNAFQVWADREPNAPSLTSNAVDFEIVPADPRWSEAEVRKAVQMIGQRSDVRAHVEGCHMLRFLENRGSVIEIVHRYARVNEDACGRDYELGLFGYADREFVVKRMEDGLQSPDVAVSSQYLWTLGVLSTYWQHPELLPVDANQYMGKTLSWSGGPLGERQDLINTQQAEYVGRLVNALPQKVGRARAASLKALFDSPLAGDVTLLPPGSPALGKLRDEVAAHFLELSLAEQQEMLDLRWEKIASPSMLPVLQRIYQQPSSDQGRPSLTELALRRIYELSPQEGRNLILKEIASGHPRVGGDVLGLLPEKELPELDGPLAENLENSVGSNEIEIFLRLIARYATPAILPRVETATEDRIGNMPCAAEWALLGYAFRADPDSAVRVLEKALDARQHTKCYTMDLSQVAKAHMNPQVEQVALARLNDPDPEIAANAAGALGRYGTAAAEQALWQRFQKWHST
jgi:hypothetical protein